MNTAVVQAKTLQERVGDRIREQIGELLTTEDLKALVDRAMEEAFFRKVEVPKRHWNDDQRYEDAFAVKHVKELLKPRVDEACKAWLAEHQDRLGAHIDESVGKGFSAMFQAWLDRKVQADLIDFAQAMKQSLGINN